MSFVLDDSTSMVALGDGRFRLLTDKRFWNFTNAFGGWVAAAAVSCLKLQEEFRGEIITQDLHFHSAIRGEAIILAVELLERRRTLDFWHVRYLSEDMKRVLASASIVAGERLATAIDFIEAPPDIRAQADSYAMVQDGSRPSWFEHFQIYLAKGRPFRLNDKPESAVWLKESDERPLDVKAICAMVDTPMPRTFFLNDSAMFGTTISLSTHIYATADEIATVGSHFVRLDTYSKAVRHSLINQESYLYREDGLLLATSYQTGLFRE